MSKVSILVLTSVSLLLTCSAAAQVRQLEPGAPGWPLAQNTEKPWTRWWWPGSAVDKESLTRQLEEMAAANIGGVEITPIYGAKGYEERYIDFLSPKFMEMLEHVGREARRLGMGVDMATGTGWPFGGPWVAEADSNTRVVLKDGKLAGASTGMMVKRAAPGDEGLVLDPYSPEALKRYLVPFEKAFAGFPRGLIRGQFHDSFEYYNAGWTREFPLVFEQLHGYDIQQFALELMGEKKMAPETLGRIKSDYRETLARLHLDYLREWVAWSHAHGFVTRNQSHGAPGNLLDLYANADVPETEIFGSTPFPIPGLRRDSDEVRHDQDLPDSLVIRMASSAAHVMGRPLASSESCTWLREHWKVALSHAKPELDRVMLDGINHIFYHGTVYSPKDAPWPGWLFYASTQFNPNNPWWDDFGAMNRYIERVQSVLQRGAPDNDILVYWPIYDIWDEPEGLMRQLSVHDTRWLADQPLGRMAKALAQKGYSFDYVSDAQLQRTRSDGGRLVTPGSSYRILLVPAADCMPVPTLQRILQLARDGATVVFEALPRDVPGYGRIDQRRAEFRRMLSELRFESSAGMQQCRLGTGTVIRGDVMEALRQHKVPREAIADSGAGFIRRVNTAGHDYFLANLTAGNVDGWVTLGVAARSATILDPLTGSAGVAALRPSGAEQAQVYLQLAPGESLILRTLSEGEARGKAWAYLEPSGPAAPIEGTWKIEFVKGGPEFPPALESASLKSWTEIGGPEAKRFGGTARYRINFEMPSRSADQWILDLGDVRESARVRLNGRDVATAWSLPFRLRVGEHLRPGRNMLELEVSNLAANRIRDMDLRGVQWKIMREINFVNINYRPFDASNWGIKESGLLGPVKLVPMRSVNQPRER